jgi:uncharacterized coiled-coil protein SlyX
MEPPSTRSERRIDELEARLAEQDRSILELSDEVYRQQRERLTTPPQGAASSAPEIPPHY